MGKTYQAVIFDFGGVITTSLLKAFRAFGASLGDEKLPLKLLGDKQSQSAQLLAAHEEGRISAAEFEAGYARELAEYGVVVEPEGLITRIQSGLDTEPESVQLVAELREQGYPVGLLSNSFGDNCYAGYDLESMFDAVTISGDIGVRKPSREAYRLACEKLGTDPGHTVMVDDLQHNLDSAARLGMAGVLHTQAAATRTELVGLLSQPGAR